MADFLQEHRLADEVDRILVRNTGLGRRANDENSSTIFLQVADLADDRRGRAPRTARVLLDLLAVAALEPLGGELDRGQRVLDLVGDAPRDVRTTRPGAGRAAGG
jgi:hypothetical protein